MRLRLIHQGTDGAGAAPALGRAAKTAINLAGGAQSLRSGKGVEHLTV